LLVQEVSSNYELELLLNRPLNNSIASVLKHFSFQRFLHLKNLQKPIKTRKPGDLETYVQIPGNLSSTSL